jgi:hypothetical protein
VAHPHPRQRELMLDQIGRSAEDILSRSVRLTLGGREFVLPVLTIAGNRRWKATLDAELASVLAALRKAGKQTPELLDLLEGQIDKMLDLLIAYDETHVLPPKDELAEIAYEDELTKAVQEVWRAANPLVVTAAMAAMREIQRLGTSPLTSSQQPSTAGNPARSRPS